MKLLLDTHIWIWLIFNSDQLPSQYRDLILKDDSELWLSPISVWEVMLLAERKKLDLYSPASEWVKKALEHFPFREASVNHAVAMQSRMLALAHQDPADRFIAATALVYDLHLITVDEKLRVSPLKYV